MDPKGRTVEFAPGLVQKDVVKRWRWFPEDGDIVKTSTLEPKDAFAPRINDRQFRSGQTIEDLYVDAFREFFEPTAKHLKSTGFNWVEIDPPWQLIEVNGLPKVSNEFNNNPNYPSDEILLEEVKAYKNQGLKVMIGPQLCCNELDTKNRSRQWWEAYFQETEKFLLHFAGLAEQAQADALVYAINVWNVQEVPLDIEQEWRAILGNIKKAFRGEVGEMVWVLGPEVSPEPSPIPDPTAIKWADLLDFIMVHSDFPLFNKDNPTDEELKVGADKILDGIKILYDKFGKPMILRNGYFNVKSTWKGQTFYSISSVPWISEPESALKDSKYQFDGIDHARTVHAYFRAIASNPWVIGYFHFGYTHWEDPLSAWMSIRGKPTEDIWRKWNDKF